MTSRTEQKLNENLQQVCRDLGIPYDPDASETDPRVEVIAGALSWMAADVEDQCKRGEWSA